MPAIALALTLISIVACTSQAALAPAVQTVEVTRLVPVTVTPPPTEPPTMPLPLITTGDFESGPGEWYTASFDESSITVTGGQLVIDVLASNWISISGHPDLDYLNSPFDLTMTVTLLESPPEAYAAVDFRYFDEDNFAEFGVSAGRFVNLAVVLEGEYYGIIPWSRQAPVTRGANILRLVDRGKRVSAYSNGELLFDLPLEGLDLGGVSIVVWTFDNGNARWAFDDIVVREAER
jgi:hypothetical protein